MAKRRPPPAVPAFLAGLDLPRVPQQARSRQKRDALLAAATRLFDTEGYETTTADDIAAAAGVSIGTFYSYFRNKRQVFISVCVANVEAILALGITEMDFGDDPRAAIRAMIHRGLERQDTDRGMRRAWRELLPRDAELQAFHDQMNELIYQQILGAVRKAEAQGLTWPGLDGEATARVAVMLLDYLWLYEPGPDELAPSEINRRRDALADMLYRALCRQSLDATPAG